MTVWLPFDAIFADTSVTRVGGKALQLAQLTREGYQVPPGGCIPTEVYAEAVCAEGFREKLAMELGRKPFSEMRWEELWDAALRIRNWFARLPLPQHVTNELTLQLQHYFGDSPVAVRSSAPAEDSDSHSFAGLHESYVGVCGPDAILQHVRLVWTSLFSDRALLYRQELNLDVTESRMAVVVQSFVDGKPSGVAFSQNPLNPLQGVIEAVEGRGEDFVDGNLEPDRWFVDRKTNTILSSQCSPSHATPCLCEPSVSSIYALAHSLEKQRGLPQDMEWTLHDGQCYVLQTRAITAPMLVDPHGADKRSWYLTLTRSLPELQRLYDHITTEVLPAMTADADRLATGNLSELTDPELVTHMAECQEAVRRSRDAYWEYCIPFAHGMRLFGIVYNDRMHPDDSHEFMTLLAGANLISKQRNSALKSLGTVALASSSPASECAEAAEQWLHRYAPEFLVQHQVAAGEMILTMAMQIATGEAIAPVEADTQQLEAQFLSTFAQAERIDGEELLRIGRASYALRDNDNHYLDRVQFQATRGLQEVRRRTADGAHFPREIIAAAEDREDDELAGESPDAIPAEQRTRGKQLIGQPSSPGMATGDARVVHNEQDLFTVKRGDVLVCDAISPAMTFVVPLCAAIVERRGGMLIHGAIIAREYGIPCVTGVAQCTDLIHTGQTVCVDGYLGHVAIRVEE